MITEAIHVVLYQGRVEGHFDSREEAELRALKWFGCDLKDVLFQRISPPLDPNDALEQAQREDWDRMQERFRLA